MCLMVFDWRPGRSAGARLLVAANRDEFHHRASAAAQPWPQRDDILGGADLGVPPNQQGLPGTWMSVSRRGRFAALTNVRGLHERQPKAASRGQLVTQFVAGQQAPAEYLLAVQAHAQRYNGFNLLVGQILGPDPQLWWLSNCTYQEPRKLAPGLYGLSNAALDTPWPKLTRAVTAAALVLAAAPTEQPPVAALLKVLSDTDTAPDAALPSTGVALPVERMLSAIFIRGEQYGTRSSQVLSVQANGAISLHERRFGALSSDRSLGSESKEPPIDESTWQFAAQP